ncbi:MAG: helix-turn-helix domain-containing protein [Candidatus Thiodiazotropha sp. (ex Lucina pensylvanica)]|nr:helix-turn-helix domain-containing protein [Candidatus Thiodiazotropha sp. (ex Lucina pensylvanica)]
MKKEMFDEFLESVREMDEIVGGKKKASRSFYYPDPEVKAIRESMGFSQARFARTFGVSKRTVENWEQGRRRLTGAARTLLRLVEADPGYARRILNA